jgi:hypothetical protein
MGVKGKVVYFHQIKNNPPRTCCYHYTYDPSDRVNIPPSRVRQLHCCTANKGQVGSLWDAVEEITVGIIANMTPATACWNLEVARVGSLAM